MSSELRTVNQLGSSASSATVGDTLYWTIDILGKFQLCWQLQSQELEVWSLYHLKNKSSGCHYVVMTRSETKLWVAIPAPVSGQSAVNVAMATSKCSVTFLLPYAQNGDVKTNRIMSQIYFKSV